MHMFNQSKICKRLVYHSDVSLMYTNRKLEKIYFGFITRYAVKEYSQYIHIDMYT